MRVTFAVRGRLPLAREEAATFGIIRHIRFPGVFSTDAVAVEPAIG